MSKQRALELCEDVDSLINQCHGPHIMSTLQSIVIRQNNAIRELAKDDTEPDPNHANMDDLLEQLQDILRELRDLREVAAKEH